MLLAFPKGRLGDELVARLAGTPLALDPVALARRSLRVPTATAGVEALLLKGTDLPLYVARGVAALGVVGADTLDEQPADVLEVSDLGFGACRLSLCAPIGITLGSLRNQPHLRIATKFLRATARWLEREGWTAELVPLQSSIELAPLVGLADAIVDLVQTGSTLRAHGLEEVKVIGTTTARLIAGRAQHLADPSGVARITRLLEQVTHGCRLS
jgi:ATP phosphoribosyltransferase